MELKDFIAETIKHVTDGVLEGNNYVIEKSKSEEGVRSGYITIDFDIGITTNKEDKDDIGGKISVVEIFNVGASKSNISSTTNQNRIKFNVLVNIKTNNIPMVI